jgi:hypothetical protein
VSTCGQGAGLCLLSQSCTAVQGFQSDTNGGHCNGVSKGGDAKASFVCCQYSSGASESIPSLTPPAPPTLVAEPTSSTTTPSPSEDVSFSKQNYLLILIQDVLGYSLCFHYRRCFRNPRRRTIVRARGRIMLVKQLLHSCPRFSERSKWRSL